MGKEVLFTAAISDCQLPDSSPCWDKHKYAGKI